MVVKEIREVHCLLEPEKQPFNMGLYLGVKDVAKLLFQVVFFQRFS